jgi:DNA polymerase-3 subunit delta'
MSFTQVIGQHSLQEHLFRDAREGRVPHALLFHGKAGHGTLALALSYAAYLLCRNPQEESVCGTCAECRRVQDLQHLDLYFTYPVIKKGENPTSDLYTDRWREFLLHEGAYVRLDDWVSKMSAAADDKKAKKEDTGDKKEKIGQVYIYAAESAELTRRMYLKGSGEGYKIALIWYPERMNEQCANKLLKLLEEPPLKSVFILVSEAPDKLLDTILSRTRRIAVPPLTDEDIAAALQSRFALPDEEALRLAHNSAGDFIEAMHLVQAGDERTRHFDRFTTLMRNAYGRDIRGLKAWSDSLAAEGTDVQKDFLLYAASLVRENFIYNLHLPINYMNTDEQQFAAKFAPFITEANCALLSQELNLALRHVEQNVNKKMVFFDLALQMTILIHKKQ